MTIDLTPNQVKVMRIIEDGVGGLSPTYKEIAERSGLAAASSAFRVVDILESRGYVRRGVGSRNITVLKRLPSRAGINISTEVLDHVTKAANARGQDIGTYIEDALMAVAGADLF